MVVETKLALLNFFRKPATAGSLRDASYPSSHGESHLVMPENSRHRTWPWAIWFVVSAAVLLGIWRGTLCADLPIEVMSGAETLDVTRIIDASALSPSWLAADTPITLTEIESVTLSIAFSR